MRPLEGLRVVDLTRVLSGPFCTMQLGDLGAEVIKVERPGEGDDTRAFAPPYQGDEAAYFLSVNRNKKSITLDMKSKAGREVLWRLIEKSDVLVENFRPGAMDRLGFGYAAVAARRPSMVYCSISGFGNTGLMKDRPGYDVIVQGEAGIQDITGPADGAPYKVGTSIADLVSGLNGSQAILAALYATKTTGRGQHVSVSMYEAVASLLSFNASIYFATGQSPKRRGNAHATIVPYETFEASDGWISLGVANDELWKRFCKAVERPDLTDDPAFCQGRRPRPQPRHPGADRQGHHQAAQARRVAAADGGRGHSERWRQDGRRSLRQRAVEVARHDRRNAACRQRRRCRQDHQESDASFRHTARQLYRAAKARRTHQRDFDRPAGLQRQRSRGAGAQRDDLASPSLAPLLDHRIGARQQCWRDRRVPMSWRS